MYVLSECIVGVVNIKRNIEKIKKLQRYICTCGCLYFLALVYI